MYCSRCGAAVPAGARFCPDCGNAVEADQPAAYVIPIAEPAPSPAPGRPGKLAGLPETVRLSSAWRRLGGYLLEGVLFVVTLIVGWLIWSIIVWGRGETPAKQLLGMRVVHRETLTAAGRGRMFVREVPCKFLMWLIALATFLGNIFYFWLLWDSERQELWDKMVDTVVVNDPGDLLDPRRAA